MNYKNPILTWLGLLLLLSMSLLSVVLFTGIVQHVVSITCAIAVAATIMIIYMELRVADSVLRTFAVGGLVWLTFFLVIGTLEFLTRSQF